MESWCVFSYFCLTDTGMPMPELDDRVIQVYKGVGKILAKYRSGKLPKAFKILPALRTWEEVNSSQLDLFYMRIIMKAEKKNGIILHEQNRKVRYS